MYMVIFNSTLSAGILEYDNWIFAGGWDDQWMSDDEVQS